MPTICRHSFNLFRYITRKSEYFANMNTPCNMKQNENARKDAQFCLFLHGSLLKMPNARKYKVFGVFCFPFLPTKRRQTKNRCRNTGLLPLLNFQYHESHFRCKSTAFLQWLQIFLNYFCKFFKRTRNRRPVFLQCQLEHDAPLVVGDVV